MKLKRSLKARILSFLLLGSLTTLQGGWFWSDEYNAKEALLFFQLKCAIEKNDIEFVKSHLKEAISKEDPLGNTALHYAAQCNRVEILHLLIGEIKKSKYISKLLNKTNNNFETPLILAFRNNAYATAFILMNHANVDLSWVPNSSDDNFFKYSTYYLFANAMQQIHRFNQSSYKTCYSFLAYIIAKKLYLYENNKPADAALILPFESTIAFILTKEKQALPQLEKSLYVLDNLRTHFPEKVYLKQMHDALYEIFTSKAQEKSQ